MNGESLAWLAGGLLVGFVLGMQLHDNESSCCARVAAGAREKAGEVPILGGVLQRVGDAIGWEHVPPLLDVF
jgi:hypothetical protein